MFKFFNGSTFVFRGGVDVAHGHLDRQMSGEWKLTPIPTTTSRGLESGMINGET